MSIIGWVMRAALAGASFAADLEELGDLLWRMLEVTVHAHHLVSLRHLKSLEHGAREAALIRPNVDPDVVALLLEHLHLLHRAVPAVVVYKQELRRLVHALLGQGAAVGGGTNRQLGRGNGGIAFAGEALDSPRAQAVERWQEREAESNRAGESERGARMVYFWKRLGSRVLT